MSNVKGLQPVTLELIRQNSDNASGMMFAYHDWLERQREQDKKEVDRVYGRKKYFKNKEACRLAGRRYYWKNREQILKKKKEVDAWKGWMEENDL